MSSKAMHKEIEDVNLCTFDTALQGCIWFSTTEIEV